MTSNITFLKLTDVMCATKKSRSSIYAAIAKSEFPAPVRIGSRAVAWTASSIAEWQEACIKASKAA